MFKCFIHFLFIILDCANMSKGITPADDYKYDLPDELKKVAEKELRESYSTIQQSVKALREWAMQNPRIAKIRMGELSY